MSVFIGNWCTLPTNYGPFRMYDTGEENVRLITMGDITKHAEEPYIRIHSSCLASEVFGARDCDCADQLDQSMRLIASEGTGIIIHLHQEGRGHGLSKKIEAVRTMEKFGVDTAESFEILNLDQDVRNYESAISILSALGISKVKLISNNPRKKEQLERNGIRVSEQRTYPIIRQENVDYLHSKNEKLGHKLPLENPGDAVDEIHFYHSNRSYGSFSNFSKHPVYLKGTIWPTSEHYYQSSKFDDAELREMIRRSPSPMAAKSLAAENGDRQVIDWPNKKDAVMYEALNAKFSQHPELRALLISSGKRRLVERPTNDDYWGEDDEGVGQNMLGKLLMQLRDQIDSDT